MISAPCRYCGTPNALSQQGICDRCNGPNELPAQGGVFTLEQMPSGCPTGYFLPNVMPSSSSYGIVPPVMLESSCPSTVDWALLAGQMLARLWALHESLRTDAE